MASIARHCGSSERGIRILCDFLVINGVLLKEDGRYLHSKTSAAFLDPRSPASLASIAQFLSNKAMREPFEQLTEVVRLGRTVLPGEGSVDPENLIWVQFAETMAPMMAPMVGPLGQVVLEGRTGPMRVLDIAAGHGLFGIEIASRIPRRMSPGWTGRRYCAWLWITRARPASRLGTTSSPAARSKWISADPTTQCSTNFSITSIGRPAPIC